jgi:TRAP-type uncharacterized transport system substrate-binding protein
VRYRVKLFLRHPWLVAILATLILAGCGFGAIYVTSRPATLKIAAGPAGATDAQLAQILAEKSSHGHDKIKLELVTTGGPAQSAKAMADRQADLAIVPGPNGNSPDTPVVAIVRQNVMALIVPAPVAAPALASVKEAAPAAKKETTAAEEKEKAGKTATTVKAATAAKSAKGNNAKADKDAETATSDNAGETSDGGGASAPDKLEKVSQLAGHRIGIVATDELGGNLLNAVLRHYGVPPDKVQITRVEPGNLAAAVRDNTIDVIFVAGPATGHAVSEAVAAASRDGVAPTFIDIDQAEGIAKRNPNFDAIDIDAGTFGGTPPTPEGSLKSLSFPEYLVARSTLDKDDVAAVAKLVFSARLALAAAMPGEVKIEAPKTEKDAAVTVHPGAHAYLADDQKTFFDKYGDDIFYGILIFPLFGSAIAALASYFRHNNRTARLRLLQRVIDLVAKAHAAASLDDLDKLQVNVDDLVVAFIHQSERDGYDDTEQTSFSFALEQVRFAIAARRDVLRAQPAGEVKPGAKAAAA